MKKIGMTLFFLLSMSLMGYTQEKVSISLMGDVLLDQSIGVSIDEYGVDYPWTRVEDLIQKSDLALINLETAIGTKGSPFPDKQFTFRSKPKVLKGVKNAGIDGVSIANNHVFDYGEEAFLQTLDELDKYQIAYAGGGKNLKQARTPIIWQKNGIKIGFLAFSRVIPSMKWYVGENKSGVLSGYDPYSKEVIKLIEDTKKKVQILIVSLHWGKELKHYPKTKDIDFAKKLIDAGADCIMGHHPHVLQGIQIYKTKPIVYSLGNFIFNSRRKVGNQSIVFQMNAGVEGVKDFKVIPMVIEWGRPREAKGKDKKEIIDFMNKICKPFYTNISEEGQVYVKTQNDTQSKKIETSLQREQHRKKGIRPFIHYWVVEKFLSWIKNLFK